MKKSIVLTSTAIIMLFSLPANAAQKIKVNALTSFDSLNPTTKMKVITLEKKEFNNGIVFENGTVIYGNIIDVKQPKRGKRNASFKFQPTSYLYNGKTHTVNDPNFIAKYVEYKEIDKLGMATSAAATAGGFIFHIPLLSEGVSFVKGAIKNPEENRLKSGAVQVYKDSPLSYVEEGKDIVIEENTKFILKFKSSDIEDLDAPEEVTAEQEETVDQENNNENSQQNDTKIKSTLPVPEEEEHIVKNIETINPDDILREVELKN